MSSTKPIVQLRVYKAENGRMNYDSSGNIINKNHLVTEIYDTTQWANYMKCLGIHGFIKVEVEKVIIDCEEEKDLSKYQLEVDKALKPEAVRELTPEQKEIADLKAKLEAFMSSGAKKEDEKEFNQRIDESLTKAREEYVKVFGKKGHHTWSVEQINEKNAEEQNKN